MDERVNSIKITNNKTGEVYELDFNRETLLAMDRDEFKIGEVTDFPATNIPKLFYYSFRKNHRKMSRQQTDRILQDVLHGLTPKIVERLILLYNQAATSNNIQDEEDLAKNAEVTVEL